jgi:hypothetical protein
MMERKQLLSLKVGDKVKLQLIQPEIKCVGRDDVTFFTKGKVTFTSFKNEPYFMTIELKYKGVIYDKLFIINHTPKFSDKEFEDLKIIKKL